MHDDFRRFCRRALPNVCYSFFSQFGFLFFLPPCSSKRFLLFFFTVWFSVFLAAVLFQTFSIWFFASAVFCLFARRAFSAPFFFTARLAHSFVFTSFRKARLRQKASAMQPFAEKYTKVWSTSYGAYILYRSFTTTSQRAK